MAGPGGIRVCDMTEAGKQDSSQGSTKRKACGQNSCGPQYPAKYYRNLGTVPKCS